ncbi:Spermidine synthase [hydrothermal vent metagenome]|uniref:Spermidine synthase n=1 Tax=hydrothermal vent metagenome TaxID=652676 RepID=A0A3B0Z8W7_9ZZZZ
MAEPTDPPKGWNLVNRWRNNRRLLMHDVVLIGIMAVLAGCGMIYEFLLSHYAARVLGATEVAIFGVFTVMIASMGLGAFAAAHLKCPFSSFAWLELLIGLIGVSSILFIAGLIAFSYVLPSIIAETYGLHGINLSGGAINTLQWLAKNMPYLMAFILGMLIGAEIPLIAKVRESVYGMHLENNTGTIYGADYIGAGIGALIFVLFLLTLESSIAAVIAASANLLAGLLFYFCYRKHIRFSTLLLIGHLIVASVVATIAIKGPSWELALEDMLYKDQVIARMITPYQKVVITKRIIDPAKAPVWYLYINGHTQFSSLDEQIYHAMLTYPAMLASNRRERILIVGGGDGLALRDVLRWNPESVVLLELDPQIIQFFSEPVMQEGEVINRPLLELNEYALQDSRVDIHLGDAYGSVDELLAQGRMFDTIIVDLPDPSHPDLNKLYSSRFYAKLHALLSGDGAIAIQSTSPYHAKEAFISIKKTVKHAGFQRVEQYHANVPSFGEWGWTIATKAGKSAKQRIEEYSSLPVNDGWMTRELMLGAFAFNQGFYDIEPEIKVNRINSNQIIEYHRKGWAQYNDDQ